MIKIQYSFALTTTQVSLIVHTSHGGGSGYGTILAVGGGGCVGINSTNTFNLGLQNNYANNYNYATQQYTTAIMAPSINCKAFVVPIYSERGNPGVVIGVPGHGWKDGPYLQRTRVPMEPTPSLPTREDVLMEYSRLPRTMRPSPSSDPELTRKTAEAQRAHWQAIEAQKQAMMQNMASNLTSSMQRTQTSIQAQAKQAYARMCAEQNQSPSIAEHTSIFGRISSFLGIK